MVIATNGTIIKTGVLVKIAKPKKMPDSKIRYFFLLAPPLLIGPVCFVETAK
jgi:hypothetical protein